MAIKALNVGAVRSYTSKFDVKPKEGEPGYDDYVPTRWKLRTLDSRVLGVLKDKSTKITVDPNRPDEEIGTQVNQNAFYFQVVQLGLDEPENWSDEKGSQIKFETMKLNIAGKSYVVATPEFVGRIPEHVISELAEEIISGNTLTVEEGNASAAQS